MQSIDRRLAPPGHSPAGFYTANSGCFDANRRTKPPMSSVAPDLARQRAESIGDLGRIPASQVT